MPRHATRATAQEEWLEATIIRADGRIEHLGVIDYRSRNPIRHYGWRLRRLVRRLFPR